MIAAAIGIDMWRWTLPHPENFGAITLFVVIIHAVPQITVVVRRLHETDLQNVQGIWTPRTLEMTDRRRKSRTTLRMDQLEYNVPLKDEEFTVQALRREQ